MSRITDAFKNKKAFIPFITCGDPNLDTTQTSVSQADKADVLILATLLPRHLY